MLTFDTPQGPVTVTPQRLAIAGWAGRDQAGVQHHIEELAELGVKPPSSVPLFYRASAQLLTQAENVEMLGGEGSGEAEVCLVSDADGRLWVSLASDHTDRKLEAVGVAESKQLCAKPIATQAWALDEIIKHWDALELGSEIEEGGHSVTYQQGTLKELLDVDTLLAKLPENLRQGASLAPNTLLLCGTVPAIGGIRPGACFSMTLHDPVLNRRLSHRYHVIELEVAQ
ncbi:DUF2848 domain-containing protein [Kushneria marisflavi]|uniref:Uncharacterized protein n=1 Tax=Kushneria marisflavi TaxID=157779 RepID=A0A240URL0_9GAMM|nr:DUF2848 domain-containing protein [Kushneria marisflavi]ART63660.1 hypothetical protein B9H00_11850 [Kushneria marisflavi]RKD85334.1 uncharacterized protein DUF2848 [Kushneria marisflavi]